MTTLLRELCQNIASFFFLLTPQNDLEKDHYISVGYDSNTGKSTDSWMKKTEKHRKQQTEGGSEPINTSEWPFDGFNTKLDLEYTVWLIISLNLIMHNYKYGLHFSNVSSYCYIFLWVCKPHTLPS